MYTNRKRFDGNDLTTIVKTVCWVIIVMSVLKMLV